jgi:hypothetical protein
VIVDAWPGAASGIEKEERLMRTSALAIVLVSTLLTGGCDNEPWIAPPSPAIVPSELWMVRETLTSVTGPETCFDDRDSVGSTSSRVPVYVRREGSTIKMVYRPDQWDLELVGSTDGDTFTVTGGMPFSSVCDGITVEFAYEMQVSGRFSGDGLTMTASATSTHRLGGGGAVVQTFDWVAVPE